MLNISTDSIKINLSIKQDERGIYVAKAIGIPGCYTQGKTIEEIMERIKEAIEVCLEAEEKNNYLSR